MIKKYFTKSPGRNWCCQTIGCLNKFKKLEIIYGSDDLSHIST
jgi:hypothetical protein